MFNNILNFEGVTVLDKKAQSNVSGGQSCHITSTLSDGRVISAPVGGFSEGSAGSGEANNFCVSLIERGLTASCGYDCEFDGFGQ